jgi:3-dehydroquinate synthetase
MYIENYISKEYGYLDIESLNTLNKIIIDFIDPKSLRYLKLININELLFHMKKDKKNVLMNISFAVPIAIGHFKVLHLKNDKKLSFVIDKAFENLLVHI